jgi:capsular polysaccharide biosynthesis protein
MQEQPLDVRRALKAVKGHRLLMCTLSVLGLAAGTGYDFVKPPLPAARALVLLPPSAVTGQPGQSPYTVTQKIIATSSPVLTEAGGEVLPPLSATQLRSRLSVTAPSQDVLQIVVYAKTGFDAKKLANAVATDYIAYVANSANGSEALLKHLESESVQLTQEILGLQRQINSTESRLAGEKLTSPVGVRDNSLLNTLRTEQEQVSIQLSNINTQVVNAEVTNTQATDATQLLEPAVVVPASKLQPVLIGLLGLLAGLLAGLALALGLARGDRRLRSRDAVATAIGVPVVGSMWAKPCRKVGEWRKLLDGGRTLSPVEAWSAQRMLQRLGDGGGGEAISLRLLVLAGDNAAAAAGAKLARAVATLGVETQFYVGQQGALDSLRSACVVANGASSGAAGLNLKNVSNKANGYTARLSVLLEALDDATPQVSPSFAQSLLVVSAGYATAADLAKVALAASDSGSPVLGVIVVNPDPDDSTMGVVVEHADGFPRLPRELVDQDVLAKSPRQGQ